ncbi:39S ribosomal protein L17, mitochondrial-like [Panonychus citri]|uniref:39S ribosomal protein L17, mitochondrial-like n=1 Tax=Panonychus citri TaxID=50023 RepID=UPI002306FD83|nr:39S ribosomal protein L17, mitochondrial-like [Panonychus citri]
MVRFFNDALNRPPPVNRKVIPALPPDVVVNRKPIKLASKWLRHGSGRLILIGKLVTDLIKFERITLPHHRALEVQGYTERLITEAMRNGDRHIPTMELADFYIHEKQLVHKLFKVLVPRYMDYTQSFTKLWLLSDTRDREDVILGKCRFYDRGCLELKGNPLPPIEPPKYTSRKSYLTNVLLDAAKKDFYASKQFKKSSEDSNHNENAIS